MKKIVAIMASPNHEGNSNKLLDEFLSGANSQNHLVSKFFLTDIEIKNYCHTFSKKPTQESEPKFLELANAIEESDAIVISTPTYNFSVPGMLKNLIDRIGYFSLDYKKLNMFRQPTGQLGDKKVFTIITGGTPWLIRLFLFFAFPGFWMRIVFAYYGCFAYSTAYAGELTYSNPAKNKPKLLQKFQQLGINFAKRLA